MNEFKFIALNEIGITKCNEIEAIFNDAFYKLERVFSGTSRETSLVLTKLQEASYFAKKHVSIQKENWKIACT